MLKLYLTNNDLYIRTKNPSFERMPIKKLLIDVLQVTFIHLNVYYFFLVCCIFRKYLFSIDKKESFNYILS